MTHFLRTLAASFVGKIFAAVFIAVCLLLGFGPGQWADWIVSHSAAQIAFIAVSFGLAILLMLNIYISWSRPGSAQPRRLSAAKMENLVASLKSQNLKSDKVAIRFAGGDNESREYAGDFADVLRRLGWRGESGVTLDEDVHMSGLRLAFDKNGGRTRVRLFWRALSQITVSHSRGKSGTDR